MNEQFIPGIYNYCDRWCERCTFTSRCRVYESTDKLTPEQNDIHNEAFWKSISVNFTKAIKMLHEFAAEQGIDLENAIAPYEMKAYDKKRKKADLSIKNSKLILLCKEYRNIALPFVEKNFLKNLYLKQGLCTNIYTLGSKRRKRLCIQWLLWVIAEK